LLPLASAVLLSVAAGFSLAEEHMGYSGQIAATPALLPAARPHPAGLEKASTTAAPHERPGTLTEGVGSRALAGPDALDAASAKGTGASQ
jgi:hypothetical protein